LSAAPLENVLELWAGLGYYSRARNLHAAARSIVGAGKGQFPQTVEELLQLPGIGRSTAGAIVSIAYDLPAPILDGNVRRVLARLMALTKPSRDRQAEKQLWLWAEALTPVDRAHDYAQAIMDLGATICLPRNPRCADCPLVANCQARQLGLEHELPVGNSKSKIPTRRQVVLVVKKNGQFLVQKRPPKGLLGGMWEFPCRDLSGAEPVEEVLSGLQQEYCADQKTEYIGMIKHVYSHFRLEADVYITVAGLTEVVAEPSQSFWHDEEKLATGPLHGAHQKVLNLIMKEMN
jgi:A/G-specific adenine glycosylase